MPRGNPAAPAVTGPIIRLTTQVTSSGQIYEVILDYMGATSIPVTLATQIAFLANWRSQVEAAWQAVLPASVSITGYIVAEVAAGLTPSYSPGGISKVGAVVGQALPGTVAAVLSKSSSLKGQHGRGRSYLMCVPPSFTTPATDPNLLNATGLAAYANLATQMLIAVAASGVNFSMCISTRPIAPITAVTQAVPVSGMTPQAILGNVRRRREGRGI